MNCDNQDDRESTVSDSTWEPQHRIDMRKHCIRDDYYKRPLVVNASETNGFYPVGIRRERTSDKFRRELALQLIEEKNSVSTIEDYCTEYDSNYLSASFDPNKKQKRNEELFAKYPLYASEPTTLYKHRLDNELRGEARLCGHTYSKRPFKKCAQFTKFQVGDL